MPISDIITQKMTFGGKSLGKIGGKTVFVPFSIPGEELKVETTKTGRDYDEAKIVEIIKPSPYRVIPPCPLYGKCGGCNMMHIENARQTELKKEVMLDVFLRAGIELPAVGVIAGSPLNYRSRMELHDGGLQERGTNNVIPLDYCPVAVPEINEYLKNTAQKMRPRGKSMVFAASSANPPLTVLRLEEQKSPPAVKGRKKSGKATAQLSTPHPVQIELCGKKILFDAKGFFQSNTEVLEKALPQIISGLSGKRALDLYSGCGTFSVFLADAFESVTMVEHNKGAVVFAEQNMAGKMHSTYAVSGENFVKYHAANLIKEQGSFDLVFTDPPRSGIEKEVLEWICRSEVPQIAYLSCDPSTQARDVQKLLQNGYCIQKACLFDFYPQTSHMETFLLCIKK